jgi:hypothetical protein
MLIDNIIGKFTVKWISHSLRNLVTVSSRWTRSSGIEAPRRSKRSQYSKCCRISGRNSPDHLSPSRAIASPSFPWERFPMASISSGDPIIGATTV